VEPIRAVRWSDDGAGVRIIDQRFLPERVVERDLRVLDDICDAIRTLAVRGAPAIGIAAAIGLVVVAAESERLPVPDFVRHLRSTADAIRATRPTAVNLPAALSRVLARARAAAATESRDVAAIIAAMRAEATAILEQDREMCRRIGEHGLAVVHDGARILTHCNAGALATGGIGTALAPVYLAADRGRKVSVLVGETRPLLQGSRLTAWELTRAGIPVTVLADNMAASLMRAGAVDLCLVGADRIAANGDVVNKVGTYALAVAARHHAIPFYVAAPSTTIDPATPSGDDIVIEHRPSDELRRGFGVVTVPPEACIHNPAFDVTPAALITAIISDRGIHRAPLRFGP
jgi:methylthioribose-1-phosphate isomerase